MCSNAAGARYVLGWYCVARMARSVAHEWLEVLYEVLYDS